MFQLPTLCFLRLIFAVAVLSHPVLSAQGAEQAEFGAKGQIDVDGLIDVLKRGEPVDNYKIKGRDLITAINMLEPDVSVRVTQSVIDGPLDFTGFPRKALVELSLPPDFLNRLERAGGPQFLDMAKKPIPVVPNNIEIRYSEITSRLGASINAQDVFFQGEFVISATNVSDRARFSGAVFAGKADFRDTVFQGDAVFDHSAFLFQPSSIRERVGAGDFRRALFRAKAIFSNSYFDEDAEFSNFRFEPKYPDVRMMFDGATFSGEVKFNSIMVEGELDFSNATFKGNATFDSAKLNKKITFDNAMFEGNAGFKDVTFTGELGFVSTKIFGVAGFQGSEFKGKAWFSKTEFHDAARFDKTYFRETAWFSRAQFKSEMSFQHVEFGSLAQFKKAEITGPAKFQFTEFRGESRFNGGAFAEKVSFEAAIFYQPALFTSRKFRKSADLSNTKFLDLVSFRGAEFTGGTTFTNTEFHGELNARRVTLLGGVSFLNTQFGGPVIFQHATFGGKKRIGFQDAVFTKPVYFRNATFEPELFLQNLTLKSYGDFRGTTIALLNFDSSNRPSIIDGRLDFRSARIGKLCLRDIIFNQVVDFSDAELGFELSEGKDQPQTFCGRPESRTLGIAAGQANEGKDVGREPLVDVNFRSVIFVDGVSFLRTTFAAPTSFEEVKFNMLADFTGAKFYKASVGSARAGTQIFVLSYTDFRDLRGLQWEQLPHPNLWRRGEDQQPISQVLRSLESSFRERKLLDDANDAYYHFKRQELLELRDKIKAAKGLGLLDTVFQEWLLAEANWTVWGLLSGYGTRFWWVIGWSLLLYMIFTLIYTFFGVFVRKPSAESARFKLRLFDLPKDFTVGPSEKPSETSSSVARAFVNASRFSWVVMFKFGPRDTTLTQRAGKRGLNYVITAQWLLGYYLLGAILYVLKETMPLINSLVTGVF